MRIVHGHSDRAGGRRSSEYGAWRGMLSRCRRPADIRYARYGGRGIAVCDRWQVEQGFENFLADMGEKPEPKRLYSLDRKDNDGPYSPENCRWATAKEQARNRCSNVWLEANGKQQLLTDWAEETGLRRETIAKRLLCGWTQAEAVTTPARPPAARDG